MPFGNMQIFLILRLKTFKILRNVKMWWISMLSLIKKKSYKILSLVVSMFKNQVTNIAAKANLDLLCDVETFLGLIYIIPLLEFVKVCPSLVKLMMFSYVILYALWRYVKMIYMKCIVI
jgi:hypothetical protein